MVLFIAAFIIAFIAVCWIHPLLVRLAINKGIVDNPDARKLQRVPVPVLGGVAVFFGIVVGVGSLSFFFSATPLVLIFTVMTVMLYVGTLDDVMDLSPGVRFLAEALCVLLLIFIGGYCANDFHGLWTLQLIPMWVAVPLTLFISVGIINSINLIDGVDGLSSGFCVLASVVFGIHFYRMGDIPMIMLAVACVGAIIPFFMHNVFGKSSRMFIGDGGTMLMGMVMSVFVLRTLAVTPANAACAATGLGLIPFTMAVLSIPVFDTVRVMSRRMLRGTSPFLPDKTHLHHLFIDLGFSHAGTTFSILTLNSLVILAWYAAYRFGWGIDAQLYIVIALGFLFTFGFYYLVIRLDKQGLLYRLLRRLGIASHIERKGIFLWLQKMVDKA